jgi:hypothetical protein
LAVAAWRASTLTAPRGRTTLPASRKTRRSVQDVLLLHSSSKLRRSGLHAYYD